jgi:hypothetical protein
MECIMLVGFLIPDSGFPILSDGASNAAWMMTAEAWRDFPAFQEREFLTRLAFLR